MCLGLRTCLDIAGSLGSFAQVRVAGRIELDEALAAAEEAASIFSRLAEQLPQVYARYVLATWMLVATVLEGLGRIDEAADIRRQLAELITDGVDH